MGAEVRFVGKIGDDYFGRKLAARMKEEGIDVSNLLVDENERTGTASIIVDADGNNQIAVAPGADASLSVEELKKLKRVFEDTDLLLTQLELPLDVVKYGIKKASESNIVTILNPAPARKLPSRLLKSVDILVPNELEAVDIVGKKKSTGSIKKSAEEVLRQGTDRVVVTLGERGALAVTKERSFKVESIPVDVVDTTGAGDAFCAGLAVGYLSQENLEEAVQLGNLAGALATTELGAQEALPTLKEIGEFCKNSGIDFDFS
jgi:ribokinase